ADFTDAAVTDEAMLSVASRVSYEIDPAIDYPRQFVGDVTLRLDDGRVLAERQDRPRGGPDLPMSRAELEAKFRGNAILAVSAERAERIAERVGELATLQQLAPLMELLTAQKRTSARRRQRQRGERSAGRRLPTHAAGAWRACRRFDRATL